MNRDDEVVPLERALAWQLDYVVGQGSPVAGLILSTALELPEVQALLPAAVRFGSLPGLRWMAAVHRLAIEREAPAVAMHLPTLGGTEPRGKARAVFMESVAAAALANPAVVAEYQRRVPQTNETLRAAVLRCALSRLDAHRPVRLYEFGCSAGLNLRADHLPGIPALEAGPLPPIIQRLGCDLEPVDINTTDGRSLLSSYVWVDDVDRWGSLQLALRIAENVSASIIQQDAAAFVRSIVPIPGSCTVIWHSAMWIYLDQHQRRDLIDAIEAVASRATQDSPVMHISWEWHELQGEGPFELIVTTWNGSQNTGVTTVVAAGSSHGTSVTLL